MGSWKPGETLVLRYWKGGGPVGALPARVVSLDGPVIWVAPGIRVKWPGIAGRMIREATLVDRFTGPWEPVDSLWQGEGVLIVGRPGRADSIWHFRNSSGWYVQLEDPWRLWRLGFDTEDHTLDVVTEPDGSWRWKDGDELRVAVDVGFFTAEQAHAIRAEGGAVLAEWPFPTGWEQWEPDPTWPLPTLPADWDELS